MVGSRLFFGLLVISVSCYSQSYTSYYTGNTVDTISSAGGGICLMGGATENDEAMKWFLSRSKGGDVLVLRTSGADGYNNYMYQELNVKVNSVETIVCNTPGASNEPYIHQKIKQAEAIWFAGGDQWEYVSFWRGTSVDSLVNDAIKNRHVVVGGTSAGMAIQGGFYFSAQHGTVTSSEALSNPYNTRMSIDSAGFIKNHLLEKVITDTHYDNPDRKGRHIAFLARILTDWGIEAKGIACEEYAAVCIDTLGLAHGYGNSSNDFIYFLQTNCMLDNRGPETCSPGSPLDWSRGNEAIKVYRISGTKSGINTFNLKDWKTGTGGTWENWSVKQGLMTRQVGAPVTCSTTDIESTVSSGLIIYPNPITGNQLHIVMPDARIRQISILDITGSMIRQFLATGNHEEIIDVSGLNKGVYLIRVESQTANLYYKVIMQ